MEDLGEYVFTRQSKFTRKLANKFDSEEQF